MKKILFALVAIALVAVSCKKNPTDDPKKDDPAKVNPTLKLELVGQPTPTYAEVACTPSDDNIGYLGISVPKEKAGDFDAKSLAEYLYSALEEEGTTVRKEATFGAANLYAPCAPEADYTLLATFLDDKETVYDMFTLNFKGGAVPQTTMTVAISYDNDTTVTYTPSGNDPYMVWMCDDALLAEAGATEMSEEVAAMILEAFFYQYVSYGFDYRYTGTMQEPLSYYFEEVTPGMKFYVMAAPMHESAYVNGPVAYETYTTPSSAEVRHFAPAKAAKFMPRR